MAFSVTPTSGEGPYTLSIAFDNDASFGHGFSFELRNLNETGSCPVDALEGARPTLEGSLFNTGTATSTSAVPPDGCRAYSASIVTDQNVILETQTIFISNVGTP